MLGVNHGANLRGSNVGVRALARVLTKRGHDVTLVQAAAPEHRQLEPDFPVEYVSTLRKSVYPVHQALRRLGGYDVVHTQDQAGGGIALRSAFQAIPWVAQIQPPKVNPDPFRKAGWRWRWIGLAARRAPSVLTPSRWLGDALVERYGIPPERVHAVPYGVGEHWLAPPAAPPAGDGALGVASVNMKGVDVALRALAALGDAHPWRLDLYGESRDADAQRRLAAELGIEGRVHFHGFVPNTELPARLARAALLLHPTPAESFGQVLAEAAAVGLPTVATRVNAVPEVVDDGRTGILCPPGDVAAFTAALDRLLGDADLRARMGAAGRARALERWRWDGVAERIEREVYAPLLDRFAGRRPTS
jgi:glycosyltransferase involved in cell wall biosynthesis